MGRGPTRDYYQRLNEEFVEGTLTCLRQDVIKKRVNNEFPLVLNIEPTNACNLKCYYCPRELASKSVGYMKWETYQRIIDEVCEYPQLIVLNLHKDGEPFIHSSFLDMANYARKKNVAKTIHVNTNAVNWSEDIIEKILDSGLDDITISIDAAYPETFKRLKKADRLDVVERNVERFFQRKTQLGLSKPFARVKIMEFDAVKKDEIDLFYHRWENIADQVQVTGVHSWSGAVDINTTDERSDYRYPCILMWYSMVVDWNGDVVFCSVDWNSEIKLGSLHERALNDIWKSHNAKKARKSQIEKKWNEYSVCQNCVVWVSLGNLAGWLATREEFLD